jgi:hypothetical protein
VGAYADQAKGPKNGVIESSEEVHMYIGVGTLVAILVIVAIIYMVRRA